MTTPVNQNRPENHTTLGPRQLHAANAAVDASTLAAVAAAWGLPENVLSRLLARGPIGDFVTAQSVAIGLGSPILSDQARINLQAARINNASVLTGGSEVAAFLTVHADDTETLTVTAVSTALMTSVEPVTTLLALGGSGLLVILHDDRTNKDWGFRWTA